MKTIRQRFSDVIRVFSVSLMFLFTFLFRAIVNPTYILCAGVAVAISNGYLYGALTGLVALFLVLMIKKRCPHEKR